MRAAISAALGVKCISATNGVLYPCAHKLFFIADRFSASFLLGAVILTSSAPASIQRMHWATVAAVSMVSVVVMVWMRMGWPLPNNRSPILTSFVGKRR